MAADVEQVEAHAPVRERDDADGVAGEVVTGIEHVREAQRAHVEAGGRQQRLLDAGREPEIVFERFLRLAQAILGEPPRGDVGLDADEVSDLARRVAYRRDGQPVPERRAVLAVVQDFDDALAGFGERGADLRHRRRIGLRALEESAVPAHHLRHRVAGHSASGPAHLRAQAPPGQEPELLVPGLSQPVEIRRDRWGVNHIYAATEQDLFFAQGYAAAKDRLFQFEMWRRQATGTVAEILGPRELERDRGARLHMFRGDLDAELAHYHPRGKAIVEAFVAGVNA